MACAIYKITNQVNGKAYIGQSAQIDLRWRRHINEANRGTESLLYNEMREYGTRNFRFEVLEENVEDGNEREIFYIQLYDTVRPNGYNTKRGGGVQRGDIDEIVDDVLDALQNSEMDMQSIAKYFKIGKDSLNWINTGQKWARDGVTYPIRDNDKLYRMTLDRIKQIHYSLKYETDKSLRDIQKEYELTKATLYHINYGDRKIYRLPGNTYPLRDEATTRRKLTPDQCRDITNLLKDSNESMESIARKYNVSSSLIGQINEGTVQYMIDGYTYPLRPIRHKVTKNRTCFSPNEIKRIQEDLRNSELSISDIAAKNEVSITTVCNINSGSAKRFYNPDIVYPIRPIRRGNRKETQPVSTSCV